MKYIANVYQMVLWPHKQWTDTDDLEKTANDLKSVTIMPILSESFDDVKEARKAAWNVVRQLWDACDVCKEWMVVDSPLFDKCIVTSSALGPKWGPMHYFEAEIHEEDEN